LSRLNRAISSQQSADHEAAMSLAVLSTIYFVVAVGLVIAIDQLVGVMYGGRRSDYSTDTARQTPEP
jgi:hypothetical protein